MIGDPVALTVRRTIERPDASLVDAFRHAPTGFITDAFNGQGCLDVAAHLKLVEQREATLDAELRGAEQAKFWNEEAVRARGGIRFLD
jgi:hypothetical protein